MSNMHRISWFDQKVRAFNYPNRETLAQKFEISTRQAQRDIEYMKETMGAPIKYNAKKRGYYYEDETFTLPNIYISDDIKKMLGFLAYNYENYTQTPKVTQIAELFKKLTGDEGLDDDIPIFDLEKPSVQIYCKIYNAIRSKSKLILFYQDPYKGKMQYKIHPYKTFHKYRTDYTVCYCEELKEIVSLRFDRISDVSLSDEKFEINPEFNDTSYNSFVKKDPYTARIRFAKEPVFSEPSDINYRCTEEFLYEVEFFQIDDFISQLINIDYWEEIISPKWLKEKLKERCTGILSKLDV